MEQQDTIISILRFWDERNDKNGQSHILSWLHPLKNAHLLGLFLYILIYDRQQKILDQISRINPSSELVGSINFPTGGGYLRLYRALITEIIKHSCQVSVFTIVFQ